MDNHFLVPSPAYHELVVLLAAEQRGGLRLPVDPHELPPSTLERSPLGRLIADGTLAVEGEGAHQRVAITPTGLDRLRRLAIDYHLELMSLRGVSDAFFRQRAQALERLGCRRVLLYGASDTARALLEFLAAANLSAIAVVDDDRRKQGTYIGAVPVVAPGRIAELEFDTLLVTTVAFQDSIMARRNEFVRPHVRMFGLFDPALG